MPRSTSPTLPRLLVVSGVFIGLQARFVPETLLCSIALYTAVFTAGAWGPDRRRSTVARAVVVVVMFSWLTYGLLYTTYAEMIPDQPAADGAFSPRNAYLVLAYVFNAIYFGAAIAFGELAWRAAAQRSLLEQRTVELEAERREVARRSR